MMIVFEHMQTAIAVHTSGPVAAAASATTGIDWLAFVLVLGVAILVATFVSAIYAVGMRLWYAGDVNASGEGNLLARTGAALCFTLCVATILFALWLIIPFFHA